MPFEKHARDIRTGEAEHRAYELFAQAGIPVPQALEYDAQSGILTLEDLRETHVNGDAVRDRIPEAIDVLADLHAAFWDNYDTFGQIGLPWRLDNAKNLARHCAGMEKGIKPYCKAHKLGDAVYREALAYFRAEMPKLLDTRFHTGKNITILHGDLHPGNLMFPVGTEGTVKFVDLEAVRMGLGAEDLAMLLAIAAPCGMQALPLLRRYHQRLCLTVANYPFYTLLADYCVALAENLFFPQKLYLTGIADDVGMMSLATAAWVCRPTKAVLAHHGLSI